MSEKIRLENKKENKKYFKKFLLMLVGGFLVGIVLGVLIAVADGNQEIPQLISDSVYSVMMAVAPYVSVVFCIVMGIVLLIVKKKGRAMIKAWDGEDEDEYDRIDNMLGNVLNVLNIGCVIIYFFFAVGFEDIVERTGFADACYFFGFMFALVVIVLGQQMIIGMTKEVNPEKKGSIYDTKFIDKWEDSCDEAEKILIYKSAYNTYTKTSGLFVALWLFCVFGNSIFGFGLMPVTLVSLIWLFQVCTYTYYAKYYSKHPDKIGVFK